MEQTKIRKLAKLALGAGLGLSVSAIYWVTMVSEMGWIGVNQIQRDASVDYRVNFLLSTFSPDNMNVWWMNIMALMTLMLFAPALMFTWRFVGAALRGRPSVPTQAGWPRRATPTKRRCTLWWR